MPRTDATRNRKETQITRRKRHKTKQTLIRTTNNSRVKSRREEGATCVAFESICPEFESRMHRQIKAMLVEPKQNRSKLAFVDRSLPWFATTTKPIWRSLASADSLHEAAVNCAQSDLQQSFGGQPTCRRKGRRSRLWIGRRVNALLLRLQV